MERIIRIGIVLYMKTFMKGKKMWGYIFETKRKPADGNSVKHQNKKEEKGDVTLFIQIYVDNLFFVGKKIFRNGENSKREKCFVQVLENSKVVWEYKMQIKLI